ncbi:MAG: hypothetical protein HY060_18025 [Proteobacteria bacterium]|nr:hypothetical protein [Pseudomonadota bacterium]
MAPPPAAAPAPLFDPQQFPAVRGQVQLFTLTPRGDIDGLILSDGTEVKTPPHLSTQLAYTVKPGDSVTVRGLRAASLALVQAVAIANDATGRGVVDNGPPGPRAMLAGPTELQGRVRMALHGREGEVNGALLDDGTILRLPPPEAYRFAALLQPGQLVAATGIGSTTALGKMFEAQQLGPSRDQLSLVETPPGPGRGRRPPPRP